MTQTIKQIEKELKRNNKEMRTNKRCKSALKKMRRKLRKALATKDTNELMSHITAAQFALRKAENIVRLRIA